MVPAPHKASLIGCLFLQVVMITLDAKMPLSFLEHLKTAPGFHSQLGFALHTLSAL